MADYEVLGPGGHARLVSDIKAYVNRADGVGTTQLADESVTMGKLATAVTDELDGIVHDGDPLNGNVLIGELAEGAVLTADDVYTAPPKGVEVFGKSTQASYTGKNLFDINGVSFATNAGDVTKTSTGVTVTANLVSGWSYGAAMIEVSNASSVTLSTVPSKSTPRIGLEGYYSDDTVAVTKSALASSVSVTLPSGVTKVRCVFYSRQTSSGAVGDTCTYNNIQLELGSTTTTYEPYTGAKPAPSPDYPQPIESVDDLTLHVCGKNLLNPANFIRGYFYVSDTAIKGEGTSIYAPVVGGTTYTISGGNGNRRTVAFTTELPAVGVAIFNANSPSGTSTPYTFTTPDNARYMVAYIDSTSTLTPSGYQLELGTTATDYVPYVGQSVEIPLSNHIARSLPDGTRDTLTLTYQGPSTREGWAWYSETLVQRLGEVDLGTLPYVKDGSNYQTFRVDFRNVGVYDTPLICTNYTYTTGINAQSLPDNTCAVTNSDVYPIFRIKDTAAWALYDASEFATYVTGVKLVYQLATPVTHDLGTVELPILPNPLTAWADGGSAQPTLRMGYERDVNIVIEQLEAQIEEILTS